MFRFITIVWIMIVWTLSGAEASSQFYVNGVKADTLRADGVVYIIQRDMTNATISNNVIYDNNSSK